MPPPEPAELPLKVQLVICTAASIVFGVDTTAEGACRITAKRAIANLEVTSTVKDAAASVVCGVVAKRAVTHCQHCPAPNEYRIIMDSAGATSLLGWPSYRSVWYYSRSTVAVPSLI